MKHVQARNRDKMARWRAAHPAKARAAYERGNAKRQADPEYRRRKRDERILREYGLTADELAALMKAQDGRCAICRRPPDGRANGQARPDTAPRLHVDHCHTTGRVRGLLCGACNTAIGLLKEDPQLMAAAMAYLASPD